MNIIPLRKRTLANVLLDIAPISSRISRRYLPWDEDDGEMSYLLDRLEEFRAEARDMIEAATGCTWDQLMEANL